MDSISVKETRNKMASILERVSHNGESFVITKFGKPQAKLVPITENEDSVKNRQQVLNKTAGMWKNDKSRNFKRINSRYGKIFD